MLFLYSDISERHNRIGYAVCLHAHGQQTWQVGEITTVPLSSSVMAEIVATTIGLSLCHSLPIEPITVFTDLDDLPAIMAGRKLRGNSPLRPCIMDLRYVLLGLGPVQFLHVADGNYNYRTCHQKSRKAAQAAYEGSRKCGEPNVRRVKEAKPRLSYEPETVAEKLAKAGRKAARSMLNPGGWPDAMNQFGMQFR